MITLAVLIPTKNRRALLERALKSVFDQTTPPSEIVVVNDGSSDGTKEFLENLKLTHSNLKVLNRGESGGVNTARNQGIKEAVSEWVAFLDDDDEFVPEAVATMKEKVAMLPSDISTAYFNSKIFRDSTSFIGGFQFQKIKKEGSGEINFYDPSYEETMVKFNLKGDCKQVIRKEVFLEEAYQFPESVNGFESYTMNLIARDNKGIRYFPQELTMIHQESNLYDRLSIIAPKKNPLPLLVLHFKQLFQHRIFYFSHPSYFFGKLVTMMKLFVHCFFIYLLVILSK